MKNIGFDECEIMALKGFLDKHYEIFKYFAEDFLTEHEIEDMLEKIDEALK